MSQTNTNTGVVIPTVTNTPEEADGDKKALVAKAAVVVEAIAEIAQLINLRSKKK